MGSATSFDKLTQLPDDFDVSLIGDDSKLPAPALKALRELAFRKAGRNPIWFLETFWSVLDPDTFEWGPFKLREYQLEDVAWMTDMLKFKRARAVVGKARQIGWTTIGSALSFHDAYFHRNHKWLIASQGENEAKGTLGEKIKDPYNRLPIWFRDRGPQVTDDNSEQMSFGNGSVIESIPATGKAGRSKVTYGVLMDEAAFVDNAADLFTALDPQCYGPLIVFSTGNGMGNFFHEKWMDSMRPDSEWDSRFRPWFVVPDRGPFRKDDEGNLTSDWYEREKRKNRAQPWRHYQEHPSSPDEMFAKTGRAALPIQLIKDEQDLYVPELRYDVQLLDLTSYELQESALVPRAEDERAHELWVWEEPLVERDPETGQMLRPPNYVMFADIAEGLEHGDRTSITVMNANTMEEVVSYLGHWPIEDLGELLNWLGRTYHIALILPERNNQGILPIDHLRRHHSYPRMYRVGPLASIPKGQKTPRYGWITNKATKPKMVHEFVKALRDGHVAIHDPRFLTEAMTFIADGRGGFGASNENHDDCVISHLGAWQGVLEVGQYEIVYEDTAMKPITFGDLIALDEENQQSTHPMAVPIGGGQASGDGTKSWTWT